MVVWDARQGAADKRRKYLEILRAFWYMYVTGTSGWGLRWYFVYKTRFKIVGFAEPFIHSA